MNIRTLSFAALTAALALSACSPKAEQSADNASQAAGGKGGEVKLLNVSYECRPLIFIKNINPLFVKEFASKNGGQSVEVQQSHGGSSKQALAVANGLAADVVTMNQTSDIELLVKKVWSKPIGTPVCRTMPCLIPVTSFSWYAKAIQNTSKTGAIWPKTVCKLFWPTRKPPATAATPFWVRTVMV